MRITRPFVAASLALAVVPSAALAGPDGLADDVDLLADARPLEISATLLASVDAAPEMTTNLALGAEAVYVSTALASDGPATLPGGIPSGPSWPIFQHGAYAVGYVSAAMVDGDFDGNTFFTGVAPLDDRIFLDDIDSGVGFGLGIGYRFEDFGFEINYQRTYHDHSFGGIDFGGGAVLNTVNFDARWYFMTDTRFQPFALIGVAVPWLDIDDGSIDTTTMEIGNANFTGLGFNFGGGLNFYITPRIALTATAGWRYIFYDQAKGVNDPRGDFINPDHIDGSGFFVYAGASFTF